MRSRNLILILALIIGSTGSGIFYFYSRTDDAEKVLISFLNADSWQDQMSYVNRLDLAQDKMKEHFKKIKFKKIEKLENYEKNVGFYTAFKVATDNSSNDRWYFLFKTANGYRVDYLLSMGIGQQSIEEIRKNRLSGNAVIKTVIAELGENAANEIENKEHTYLTVKLIDPNTNDWMNVKLPKLNVETRDMFYYLKSRKPQPFIVSLSYSDSLRDFTIVKVHGPEAPNVYQVDVK